MTDEIVEQLQEIDREWPHSVSGGWSNHPARLCVRAAADTITSLIEERDWWRDVAEQNGRETSDALSLKVKAQAEAEALRKALREIADECGNVIRPGGQTYERTMVVHFARKVHDLVAAALPTPEETER